MANGDTTIDWGNPTEEQTVALAIVAKQKPRNLTEFQGAEFIILARYSLWYTQAKKWTETPPDKLNPIVQGIWKVACQFIIKTVDSGYDAKAKTWWNVAKMDRKDFMKKAILLMDFGQMVEQYRRQSLDVISTGFEIFIDIVCGKGWERRFKSIVKELPSYAKQ